MNPLHILVVHPDPVRREKLVDMLRRGEHTTTAVGTAGDALERIALGIDAMLLDLSLPQLDMATLSRAFGQSEAGEPGSLDDAERRHLSLVLRHTDGNKRRAAHILGISRSTLLNKVRKYGLDTP
jgi:DNA-binding NtrC family response regulator